jgi:VanZ family protein
VHKKNILLFTAIFWTLSVTYLSLVTLDSSIGSSIKIQNKDKMVHFVFYFLFTFLWVFYMNFHQFNFKKSIIVLLIAIVYGVIMEFFQGFLTTTRSADVFDVIANTFGAFFGWTFSKIYLQNKRH